MSANLLQLHKHAIFWPLFAIAKSQLEQQIQPNFPSAFQLSKAHYGAAAVTAVVTSSVVAQVEKSGLNASASALACSLKSMDDRIFRVRQCWLTTEKLSVILSFVMILCPDLIDINLTVTVVSFQFLLPYPTDLKFITKTFSSHNTEILLAAFILWVVMIPCPGQIELSLKVISSKFLLIYMSDLNFTWQKSNGHEYQQGRQPHPYV